MMTFLSYAKTVSGLPLAPGDPKQIDQLEESSGHRLPSDWRYFLEVAGGDGGALRTAAVEEHATVDDQFEFLRLDWLIEAQQRLVEVAAVPEALGCPVFVVSTFTGSGTRLVIAGADSGSPLLMVDGFDDDPKLGSGSLAGTSFSSYLDALLVPSWVAERNRNWGDPQVTVQLERQASQEEVVESVARFDALLGGLCTLDIGDRGDVIGLANMVGPDHPWFRKPIAESGVELVIPDGAVSSLRSGLMLLILSLAMAEVLGGHVVDHCGCLGEVGREMSPHEAAGQLEARHAVDGGVDELVLRFRHRHF